MFYMEYDSPLGILLLESDGRALTGLWMDREPEKEAIRKVLPIFQQVTAWLDAYFRGQPREIDFPMAPQGTAFQQCIWRQLMTIPFGETRTYGSLAREAAALLGKERMSAQAVGGAVGRNPISILIPCHRVVGSQGQLTGYAGGLWRKQWLLRHELKEKGTVNR